MPNHQYHWGIRCPDCQALLTSADRIHRNALQTLLFPKSKRFKCDNCGLKFFVNTEKNPDHRLKRSDDQGGYELPPIAPQTDSRQNWATGNQPRKRRTTQLQVTDCPDIPGIKNSAEKYAVQKADQPEQDLQEELKRLRNIEKKYSRVKKANQYLAKAAAHNKH